MQDIRTDDWSEAVSPFWGAVIKSALSTQGFAGLFKAGWTTIKVMSHALHCSDMVKGGGPMSQHQGWCVSDSDSDSDYDSLSYSAGCCCDATDGPRFEARSHQIQSHHLFESASVKHRYMTMYSIGTGSQRIKLIEG